MNIFIILSILFAILSAVFFIIGFYIYTHPKRFNKNKKVVYNSKAVATLLVIAAIMFLFFIPDIIISNPDLQLDKREYSAWVAPITLVFLIAIPITMGIIGLLKKRIIIYKDTPLIRKHSKKYQKAYNIFCILIAVGFVLTTLMVMLVLELTASSTNTVFDNPDHLTVLVFLPFIIFAIMVVPPLFIDFKIQKLVKSETEKRK